MSYNIDTGILRFTVVGANALKTTLYIFRHEAGYGRIEARNG